MHSAGQPATTKPGDRCGIVGAKGCDGQPIDQHCQLGARGAKPSRFAVGDSEDGAFWTAFLRSLKARGLQGVQLVIADAHLGLRQAVQATMAGAAIQRCRVHFLRDVLASAPKGSAEMVAAAIRTIFAQPDATHVHEQLDVIAGMLGRQFPKLETMLRDAGEELLAFTSFPISHGRRSGPRMKVSRPWWHCPPVLAPLGSVWGVVDPGAKSRVLGLEALPRSFAPLRA